MGRSTTPTIQVDDYPYQKKKTPHESLDSRTYL